MWKLVKLKNGILEILDTKVEFEDTFSCIHIKDFYLRKYNLIPPCTINKVFSPTVYTGLSNLIAKVNLFKPREEVPNKRVTTDVPGKSKLIRSKQKDKITLCFRVKNKKGEVEKTCISSNTCYISEYNAFKCMRTFNKSKGFRGTNVYSITPSDNIFKYWSDFMDNEYVRLAGPEYRKIKKPVYSYNEDKVSEAVYFFSKLDTIEQVRVVIGNLVEKGFILLDDHKENLYRKDGYWVCNIEEMNNLTKCDLFKEALVCLSEEELDFLIEFLFELVKTI